MLGPENDITTHHDGSWSPETFLIESVGQNLCQQFF